MHGQHSNTILVGLPPEVVATRVTAELFKMGWLVRAETQGATPNHLRITLGPPEQMQQLCALLEPYRHGERAAKSAAEGESTVEAKATAVLRSR